MIRFQKGAFQAFPFFFNFLYSFLILGILGRAAEMLEGWQPKPLF